LLSRFAKVFEVLLLVFEDTYFISHWVSTSHLGRPE
jgi:hypothetical protein